MPLILPGNVGSATAATGFDVDNSCRFNSGDSPVISRTLSDSEGKKFSFSVWLKRSKISYANCGIFGAYSSGSDYDAIYFDANDNLDWFFYGGSGTMGQLKTNRKFRDIGAWYHILCVYDSANGTAGNRMRMYINGVEETSFATDTNPGQNTENNFNNNLLHVIGEFGNTGDNVHFGGYMSEVVFLDNVAASPTDFGEFDSDSPTIWKPIDVSGLTFGTNGFYLDFKASGNLGNDANGGTDWDETNLAATDQSIDTCTNNFATMNVLQVDTANWVFTEGNLHVAIPSSTNWKSIFSTFGVANGKWYYEVKVSGNFAVGIALMGGSADSHSYLNGSDSDGGGKTDVWRYRRNGASAYYSTGSSSTSITPVPADNDIIGIAYNADAGAIYSSINGSWQNSATIAEIAAGTTTNALFDDITTGVTFAIFGSTENADNLQFNFGSPIHSISSGNADGNGYGSFEYAVPSNFYSICTKNLAEYG